MLRSLEAIFAYIGNFHLDMERESQPDDCRERHREDMTTLRAKDERLGRNQRSRILTSPPQPEELDFYYLHQTVCSGLLQLWKAYTELVSLPLGFQCLGADMAYLSAAHVEDVARFYLNLSCVQSEAG